MEVSKKIISGNLDGDIVFNYRDAINYSHILNYKDFFTGFYVSNRKNTTWTNVVLNISGECFEDSTTRISSIPAGVDVSIPDLIFIPKTSVINSLEENLATSFCVSLSVDGTEVFKEHFPVILLAYNQWVGLSNPEQLCSFITPNAPSVGSLLKDIATTLKNNNEWEDGIVAYDCEREHVIMQVEAAYQSIRNLGLSYSMPPASWTDQGQRVRMSSDVISSKIGTCLDLSLLCCSVLEQMGLSPCVILLKNHAVPAVWVTPPYEQFGVVNDYNEVASVLGKDLIAFESIYLTKPQMEFADAILAVNINAENFLAMVDVRALRKQGIRPILASSNVQGKNTGTEDSSEGIEIRGNHTEKKESLSKLEEKIQVWERKLLDLTLRNPLLNLEKASNIYPIQDDNIAHVLSQLGKKDFYTLVTAKDPFKSLKKLSSEELSVLKETGTDPLFLTMGTLKWFEEGSRTPRFAPIILVPVSIVKLRNNGFTVRRRDEDAMINLTLIECLRQLFEIDTEDFIELPLDNKHEIDYEKIFASLRESISLKKRWEIVPETMLGIFSFDKFVLWHDVHTGKKELAKSQIIKSLAEKQVLWEDEVDDDLNVATMDRSFEPTHLTLPIDADSSQMEAVAAAAKGRSFVLHGPPGTGKSQTITNIIADSLRRGKRVCFVSQKKAALEVVQARLEKIGLGPFSLELHSKKAHKKQILGKLDDSMATIKQAADPYSLENISKRLFEKRKELLTYIDELHQVSGNGFSLHDYIQMYTDLQGEEMQVDYRDISTLKWEQMEEIYSLLKELDIIESILECHPADHNFCGMIAKNSDLNSQKNLEHTLDNLHFIVSDAKKSENSILNKLVFHKPAIHFAKKHPLWKSLSEQAYVEDHESFDDMCDSLSRWSNNQHNLLNWLQYCRRVACIYKYPVGEKVIAYYINNKKSGKATADAFRKGYLASMASAQISSKESLRFFEGRLFAEVIEEYRKINKSYHELVQKELCCSLAQNANEAIMENNNDLINLQSMIATNGRGCSLRMIMNSCFGIISKITPCMLMSPLSVAQFLELDGDLFDLIIFDEASQMPTCDAVGAIARGKSFIVVGDPKQLPPTSFFDRTSNYDSGNPLDDLDSILDESIAINMPSRYLKWHYRSRHESLIAFSNNNFYNGRLVTFPSVDDRDRKVTFREVKGYYDFAKSRSNKEEAKEIVSDVISRLECAARENRVPDSIGIIAFSKAQSTLIETILSEQLASRGDLEECLSSMKEELIVKNLETVQGDERDVILFSIGYGPDKRGRVSMNFGPLNNAGGERRLNVAVSRARKEMVVFSTLKPEMIDLQKTAAKGVIYLKRFLEYARDGILPVPYNQLSHPNSSAIAECIAAYLEKHSYICDLNVGKSDFRIDIAVRTKDSNKYCLGIILDGEMYRDTPGMRDREIVRPSVLRGLGWNIVRVWTVDWFQRKDAILSEILSALMRSLDS